ncbi:hypothetical protein M422DRAFT_46512 [Sphaerobolus stellatus SS14]|uniref:Uncharacterized protein n=1 Tax=Sphaerobolus stellatus (strain SS14) TaxID=990650 RepID=A0A0C9VTN8_SPHS4|nr:hypothetical protein M422DRAFT_46512 [Sphaerobolus stellatus SS14]
MDNLGILVDCLLIYSFGRSEIELMEDDTSTISEKRRSIQKVSAWKEEQVSILTQPSKCSPHSHKLTLNPKLKRTSVSGPPPAKRKDSKDSNTSIATASTLPPYTGPTQEQHDRERRTKSLRVEDTSKTSKRYSAVTSTSTIVPLNSNRRRFSASQLSLAPSGLTSLAGPVPCKAPGRAFKWMGDKVSNVVMMALVSAQVSATIGLLKKWRKERRFQWSAERESELLGIVEEAILMAWPYNPKRIRGFSNDMFYALCDFLNEVDTIPVDFLRSLAVPLMILSSSKATNFQPILSDYILQLLNVLVRTPIGTHDPGHFLEIYVIISQHYSRHFPAILDFLKLLEPYHSGETIARRNLFQPDGRAELYALATKEADKGAGSEGLVSLGAAICKSRGNEILAELEVMKLSKDTVNMTSDGEAVYAMLEEIGIMKSIYTTEDAHRRLSRVEDAVRDYALRNLGTLLGLPKKI